MEEIKVNKYQTEITDELLDKYPQEVQKDFMEFITTVPFIRNLISPKREYAKDRPRDDKGRIIVDLANPHILEDMDYFRPSALHYIKYGTYTNLKPNRNPNSPYGRWIREEIRRCWEGYVRPSDGEWVTGYMYFYLNYVPMMVTKASKDPTKKRASRVEGFPEVWESTYWRFHYIDQARNGGKYNDFEGGNHAVELSKRGSGKAHPYDTDILTPDGMRKWGDLQIGDYVYGDDGKPTEIIDIPFDAKVPIYRLTLKDGRTIEASEGHLWKVLRHNHGIQIYSTVELLKIYKAKRKVSYRNPSGVEYTCGIVKNEGIDMPHQPVGIDPYTFGLLLGDGCFCTPKANNSLYYTCQDSDFEYIGPLIPYETRKRASKYAYSVIIPGAGNYLDALGLWMHKSEDKFIPKAYLYNDREVRKELLMGLIDSDGYVSNQSHPMNGYEISVSSKQFAEDIMWLCRSLGYNVVLHQKHPWYYNKNKERVYGLISYRVSIYTDDVLSNLPRKNNICSNSTYSRSRQNSTRIINIEYVGEKQAKCITVNNASHCYLVGDFITSHNSFSLAAIMAHNLILGENEEAHKRTTTILTAYLREYLAEKDGTLSKFTPIKSFLAEHTQFPRRMLIDSPNRMSWKSGYKDKLTGADMGDQNILLGLSSKDDEAKIRGKRGYILFEEFGSFPKLIDIYNNVRDGMEEGKYVYGLAYMVGCICADTMVWTINGRNIPIQQLQKEDGIAGFSSKTGYDNYKGIYSKGITKEPIAKMIAPCAKECVEIVLSSGNVLRCSKDHPLLTLNLHTPRIEGTELRYHVYTSDFIRADKLKIGQRVCELREIGVFGEDSLFDARLVGMLIGDGSYGYDSTPTYCSEDVELQLYIENNYDYTCILSRVSKSGKIYKEYRIRNICPKLRQVGIYGQVKKAKRLPVNYQTLSKKDCVMLLSGLYDTDGSVFSKGNNSALYLTQSNREILEQILLIWRKFGVIGSISEIHPKSKAHISNGRIIKNKDGWFNLTVTGRENIQRAAKVLQLLVPHKADTLKKCSKWFKDNRSKTPNKQPKEYVTYKIVSIKNIGEQTVYNLSAAFSHTYLANNIITHNTSGDDDSDFHGAQELVYNPKGYNVYAIPNNWDKPNQGRPWFAFFTPAYVGLKGFYNRDGVSDVVGGLLHILQKRFKAKYETSDPKTIIKNVTNMPVTPSEAMLQGGISQFPVTDIEARLLEIKSDPNFYDSTYVGQFTISDNKVEFTPTADSPIRYYQQRDNKNMPGAVEIYEMPQTDADGKIYENRYIAGADPYDNDESTTTSLGSILMLDLWTDRIVAEYTGRPPMADDYFEICRRMCLFYNARLNYENNKKGLFAHFSKMNSTYLLTDVLDILVDKQMMKPGGVGNTAHPYSQLVKTPDGIKCWGDIKVGDTLYNDYGGTTKVTAITFDDVAPIYRITLNDGRSVEASDKHLWRVYDWSNKEKVVTTEEMFNKYYRTKKVKGKEYKEYKYYIPANKGVEYQSKDVPLPAYFIGIMLGDGCFTQSRCHQAYFTSSVEDMKEYMQILGYEYKTIDDRHHRIKVHNVEKIFKSLNLGDKKSHTKFIPDIYKYNLRQVRLDVLKGLMDTDGTIDCKNGYISYTTVSEQLAKDVIEIARSLGINCKLNISSNEYGKIYMVSVYALLSVFKLRRKKDKQRITKNRGYKTAICNIEYIRDEKAKCVEVDSVDNCYLIGDFVTTHNCKGTNASQPVNGWARQLITKWLLTPQTTIVNENGEDKEVTVHNLNFIKNMALLIELSQWNPLGNFDRVSALGMLMLLREDKLRLMGGRHDYYDADEYDPDDPANDDFFKDNYPVEDEKGEWD